MINLPIELIRIEQKYNKILNIADLICVGFDVLELIVFLLKNKKIKGKTVSAVDRRDVFEEDKKK